VTDDTAPDLAFSEACAKEYDLPHIVVRLAADELIQQFLPTVIGQLKIYNGMLIRNSLVIAAVFQKASELGYSYAIVGDGADELFGGYSFMWNDVDNNNIEDAVIEWRRKRDDMCAQWTFSTSDLAQRYGIQSYSPYTDPQFVDWAIANTDRQECIGVRPIRLFYGQEPTMHLTGKIILREAYDTVSSWRRKDPIEVGSGATIIGHDDYWKDSISDEQFTKEAQALSKRGYRIRSKETLANFRVFEQCFGVDGMNGGADRIKRLPMGQGCVDCCFDIGHQMFCHMCGAYPAQRSKAATHYYDNDLRKMVAKEKDPNNECHD